MNIIEHILGLIRPLELNMMPEELETIYNVCKHLGIVVTEDVETETIAPGVRVFWGFDKHSGRMLRYKAIELGYHLAIEPYA